MRAAVYLRISQDRSGDELGVDRQREDAEELITRRGWSIHSVHVDNDKSATHGRRPEWEAMVAEIETGNIQVVVGWTVDRILRSGRDRLRLLELGKAHGIILAPVRGSEMDLSTPAGRLAADILGAVALHEVESKSDRQRRAQLQAAEQGRRAGGRRPFGYEDDGMTIVPQEATAVRAAYADVLAGVPLGAIARDWNGRGLLTGKLRRSAGHEGEPAQWTHDTVRRVLLNARNAGIRTYKREEMGPAVWPALVPEETFRAVKAVLAHADRNSGGSGHVGRQLLTGVALCANPMCGMTVHGGGAAHKRPIYRCRSDQAPNTRSPGSHVNRLAEPVDAYIRMIVIDRLARADARDLVVDHQRPDVAALREGSLQVSARLDSLATEFADGELTASQLRVATERLRSRLAELQAEIADAGRLDVLGPLIDSADVADAWDLLDVSRQRAVIDLLMIVRLDCVGRGVRTFRPDSVAVEWKAD